MKHAHQHFVIGCVLAVVGGVIVWTLFVCDTFACIPNNDRPDGDTFSSGRGEDETTLAQQSSFVITASPTEPMAPGVRVPLDLLLKNSNDTKMSVTDVEVTVQKVEAPNSSDRLRCLVGDFSVEQAADGIDLTLPPGTTRTLSALSLPSTQWPKVGMRNTSVNQDGCKGASLTLAFSADGAVAP